VGLPHSPSARNIQGELRLCTGQPGVILGFSLKSFLFFSASLQAGFPCCNAAQV
jgi:hypothetical protein